MAAHKDIHIEFGEFVYRADVEHTISRDAMFSKRDELLARFGNTAETRAVLDDIYDDITDNPAEWEHYGRYVPPSGRAVYEVVFA